MSKQTEILAAVSAMAAQAENRLNKLNRYRALRAVEQLMGDFGDLDDVVHSLSSTQEALQRQVSETREYRAQQTIARLLPELQHALSLLDDPQADIPVGQVEPSRASIAAEDEGLPYLQPSEIAAKAEDQAPAQDVVFDLPAETSAQSEPASAVAYEATYAEFGGMPDQPQTTLQPQQSNAELAVQNQILPPDNQSTPPLASRLAQRAVERAGQTAAPNEPVPSGGSQPEAYQPVRSNDAFATAVQAA